MIGRTDIPSMEPDSDSLLRTAAMLQGADCLFCSPLARCRNTSEMLHAISPALPRPRFEDRLMEQDFGDWESRTYGEVDAWDGLDLTAMAALRPPGGESFLDLLARTQSVVADIGESHRGRTIAVIAHAGVIRAAVALALDMPPHRGLSLAIAPLSVTALTDHGDGGWAVEHVNRT